MTRSSGYREGAHEPIDFGEPVHTPGLNTRLALVLPGSRRCDHSVLELGGCQSVATMR